MKGLFKEFETFALRGNAVDLAVGVVIGAAFAQITNALANNILTPIVGLLIGGFNISNLAVPLLGGAVLQYGLFLQAVLNFILIAAALFVFVKFFNTVTRRRDERSEGTPPPPSPDVVLLTEIRDTLKAKL